MCTLYDRIITLCREKGVSGSRMCLDLGLSKSTLSDIKSGRKKGISTATAQKIANYLGVSVGYLLGENEKEKPLINGDEELTEYLEMLKTRPECRMLFQLTKDATKEDVEAAVRIIEALRNK